MGKLSSVLVSILLVQSAGFEGNPPNYGQTSFKFSKKGILCMVLFIRLGFILLVFILASGLSIEMSSSAKKLLRQLVKTRVADLSSSSATLQSEEILKQLRSLEEVQSCRMPSIFLSMAGEVDTMPIVDFLLQTKGVIALPKVTGPKPHEMIMLPAYGRDEIATFVKTKWGIPEPPLKDNYTFEQCREIDLVFVPGVGFDKTCARVGHGRGYYDSFIDRLTRLRLEAGLAPPICIGLALSEQIVEDIPMDENDRHLDMVVTQNEIIRKSL